MNYPDLSKPNEPIFCGEGPMDPFLRNDANALTNLRFSTGRLVADLHDGEIVLTSESEMKLFGYGVEDLLPASTGYDTNMVADDALTNCNRGGELTQRGLAFFTVGMAARVGVPYLCLPSGRERYPSWLDEVLERKIRTVVTDSCAVDITHGTIGQRFRLGSLVTTGAVFDYATGKPPESTAVVETCGNILRHASRTFATCALARGHEDLQHRHGTIIWTTEDAENLVAKPEQPFEIPKAFSPFLVASLLGTDEDQRKAHVNIRTRRSDLIFDVPANRRSGRIAIPIRVWLFGYPVALPMMSFCSIPSPVDFDALAEAVKVSER